MDNRLIPQLKKGRKNLKYKYRTPKLDIPKLFPQLEETYYPLTKPLEQPIGTIEKNELETPQLEYSSPKSEKRIKPRLKQRGVEMKNLSMIEPEHSMQSLQPANLSKTKYETGGEGAEYYYIDESFQQLAK